MNSPVAPTAITRREALKRTFIFSAALALAGKKCLVGAEVLSPNERQLLMIGDWGAGPGSKSQAAVASAMQAYTQALKFTPEGLFLLGDNFYGAFKGGLTCPRWKTEFEDMYPAASFPGPCWAMLGNHDYDDEPVTKLAAELGYAAANPGTRWTMPAKWYRVDWPAEKPLVTWLVLDSNFKNSKQSLTPEERQAQLAWFKAELAKPRVAPWLVCMGHHPLYTNGAHGDNPGLIEEWGDLFQKHSVDFYFSGHDHDLQHLELENLRTSFVISGGGGAKLRDIKRTDRGPFARSIFGFTHLQISTEKFTVRHLDANKNQIHAFSRTPAGKVEILG